MGLMDFKGFVYQCWYCNKLFKPEQVLRICNKAKDSESKEFRYVCTDCFELNKG
jgi:hypothetical protein